MRNRNAVAIAIALTCAAYAVTAVLTDRVFWDTRVPPGKEHRAALAIRDDVTPFQKWGTKTFTWRYVSRYYDAAWYFTQSKEANCEEAFVTCLGEALERYAQVDLFLLAHSNKVIDWVTKLPAEPRKHIRLVYNTGCHNLPQGPRWLSLGAQTYVGHPGTSASSVFYVFFLRRWTRGYTVQEALETSNALMDLTFRRAAFFSLGRLDAARLNQESVASCVGDGTLRLEDNLE